MIEQLDCTIRDGGYINNWRFNNEFIDTFTKVIEHDCSYVEIGFVNLQSAGVARAFRMPLDIRKKLAG